MLHQNKYTFPNYMNTKRKEKDRLLFLLIIVNYIAWIKIELKIKKKTQLCIFVFHKDYRYSACIWPCVLCKDWNWYSSKITSLMASPTDGKLKNGSVTITVVSLKSTWKNGLKKLFIHFQEIIWKITQIF